MLAGTVPASGPGIRVTVNDPEGGLTLNHLLDGIEELRNAGVEAIEINDRVRVVAQTSFEDDPDGVRVDGVLLKPPYVIDAIGDADTLAGRPAASRAVSSTTWRWTAGRCRSRRSRPRRRHRHPEPAEPRYAEPVPGQ